METEILSSIKKEESESDSEYEFQFVIDDKDYDEIIKRIVGEDSDIEDMGEAKPQCPQCQKTFTRNSTLKRHMIIHDPNRSHVEQSSICEVCGKLIKGAMNTHLKTHSDEKPYICDICSKGFRTKGALKVHQGLHTGEKPFTCDSCPKSFLKKHTLQVHMATHSGHKPFICDTCQAGFKSEAELTKHFNTHTKPFSCECCLRSFSHKRSLRKHQKVKHGFIVYKQ